VKGAIGLRIGYIQNEPIYGQRDDNLQKVAAQLQEIDADLVVLPEMFSTGYLFASHDELLVMAEEVPGGPTTAALQEWATATETVLVGGLPERTGDRVYNSAVVMGPNGLLGIYRKLHLFLDEKELFEPGTEEPTPINIGDVPIGILICFDWIFPEATRVLALKGAQVVCHCANLVLPYCQPAMVTRAIENRIFIVTSNRVGTEQRGDRELRFTGMSQIVTSQGEVLHRASESDPAAAVVEIEPAMALDKWITPKNHLFYDRRVDLYQNLTKSE
jgi:predicted amidohydrolase